MSDKPNETAHSIRLKINGFTPSIGIILGSGLGSFTEHVAIQYTIPYTDIPGFPVSTVEGHDGKLIFGTIAGKNVVVMKGRFHYYEGYTPAQIAFPIRVMQQLGITTLFVSNAAGGINPNFEVGDLMIISDHINFIPNPLIGPNVKEFGVRFPDMSDAYNKTLVEQALLQGNRLGITLQKGCYVAMSGPCYETPAEIRFLKTIGADAVGMSTTPEVITAVHCSIKVFALSVITNKASVENTEKASHDDVVRQGILAQDKMAKLFIGMIANTLL